MHVEKRLTSRERSVPEAIARLRSEAALLGRLSALGVTPRLLAHGEDAGGPWLRTARLRAPTLAERLAEAGGPLSPLWLERAIASTFRSLAAVHEAEDAAGPLGVVHADLSPANLAIDDAGALAFLLDFDLAWWREGPARDGAFRGTIAYAAPEVARGERPSPRSDLFSLAATLLHAVTGVAPRSGPSLAALLAVAGEEPLLRAEHAQLEARGPGHAALLACLAHAPEDRPPSARALVERTALGG